MLRISICPGIGKDADTAPKGLLAPTGGGRAFQPKAQPFGGQQQAATYGQPAVHQQQYAQPAAVQQPFGQPAAAQTNFHVAAAAAAAAAVHTTNPFAQQQFAQAAAPAPAPPAAAPAPQADTRPKCRALYAHTGQTATELSFQAGDVIYILKKDPGGWWEGELNGKRGWVPHNYVQEF